MTSYSDLYRSRMAMENASVTSVKSTARPAPEIYEECLQDARARDPRRLAPQVAPGWLTTTPRIALEHTDIAGLRKVTHTVHPVSDPASPLYGLHLSQAGLLLCSSAGKHLIALQLADVSAAGDLLQTTVLVGAANALLAAQFNEFTHVAKQYPVHPPDGRVPAAAQAKSRCHCVYRRELDVQEGTAPASCADVVNPSCLEAMYGYPHRMCDWLTLGVNGFIQFANAADLQVRRAT
ncbi:hypothetical protein GGX14DRAFT_570157 [Mycena pura]|uniref:Uncharacterized protein n=1 Tax=Mycena pura TaxID=153505 RepID=A0AAD6V9J1_9AGAR|nr:hypothetical protein GGX14DRAFT_570157 [Mycena pura]